MAWCRLDGSSPTKYEALLVLVVCERVEQSFLGPFTGTFRSVYPSNRLWCLPISALNHREPSLTRVQSLFSQEPVQPQSVFREEDNSNLQPLVRKYLENSIEDGTPLASAVLLKMKGEIKLKGWMPFTATQVIRKDRGFIWEARVKSGLTYITGFDQMVDGVGSAKWKLFGLWNVMSASGADVTLSAEGRMAIESIMLPSLLCQPNIEWATAGKHATATVKAGNHESDIVLEVGDLGQLHSVSMLRWGSPDGGNFGLLPFGGFIDEEKTFNGYTIPSQLRVGWHFGTDQFTKGEFFRCQILDAEFIS